MIDSVNDLVGGRYRIFRDMREVELFASGTDEESVGYWRDLSGEEGRAIAQLILAVLEKEKS